MLLDKRLSEIIKLVEAKKSITVLELMEYLGASESTIRRDLSLLDKQGRVVRVHGGAIAIDGGYTVKDLNVEERNEVNREDKVDIARYAAKLITDDDFVYIDAGTTTERIIDFLECRGATFVTNGIAHGKKLSRLGYTTYILGGQLKESTEAIVGEDAIDILNRYNFTKGFFGTNGISKETGYSTPDAREAMVKKKAISKSKEIFVLADKSKFSRIAPVTFMDFNKATIITKDLGDKERGYKNLKNVLEVNKR